MNDTLPLFEPPEARVLSVGQLTRWIQDLLEGELGRVRVEGEISGLKVHASSGHAYFALRDPEVDALIQCVIWASTLRRIKVQPREGQRVRAVGRVTVYAARGSYQLYVDRLERQGEGELQAAFLELRARLEAEGLFAADRKVPLPGFPRRVGIVTAPDGAAFRDLLRVLAHRWPVAEVLLWPAQVQGLGAADSIARGIRGLDGRGRCDVLVVGRGGGSLEDLWAFNEETVVRAIAACRTPIVSAVGHEVDFTISDFVADQRAATPTHAAALVTPDIAEVRAGLRRHARTLRARLVDRLSGAQLRYHRLAKDRAFLLPDARVRAGRLDLDRLADRLVRALRTPTEQGRERLVRAGARLQARNPELRLERARRRVEGVREGLLRIPATRVAEGRRRLEVAAASLRALGPESVLARGYGIVWSSEGRLLRDAGEAALGSGVHVRLARGQLECRVEARTIPRDGEVG